jgi:hypothetical protein
MLHNLRKTMKREDAFHPETDRYVFDFGECRGPGWLQVDTWQDAPYFGLWINTDELKTVQYCEGDITRTTCETEADFIAEVRSTVGWFIEKGSGGIERNHIDPLGREARLVALGLDDLCAWTESQAQAAGTDRGYIIRHDAGPVAHARSSQAE